MGQHVSRVSRRHAGSNGAGRLQRPQIRCSAAAGASSQPQEDDPYQVLGVSPLAGFDAAKTARSRKVKDAERRGDQATMDKVEAAYDKIMMRQLTQRKEGFTYGSVKVSNEVKYADRVVSLPWMPRRAQSSKNNIYINLAISATFAFWILSCGGQAEYKPLQFLIFAYMYQRVALAQEEEGGDEPEVAASKKTQNAKTLMRALGLVFGNIAVAAFSYTFLVKALDSIGRAVPSALATGQELFVTLAASISLFLTASYYR
eukprot:SM000137S00468  [mRNA]  locus=s137:246132:249407:- [translate_table: standard]